MTPPPEKKSGARCWRQIIEAALAYGARYRRAAAAVLAAAWLATGHPGYSSEEGAQPYSIMDGKVDRQTYNGYRRYNASCNHCHGPDGVGGSFGPSLIASPLPRDAFRAAVLYGRENGTSVMKGFADDPNIAPYVDDIYGYLSARADGALGRGRPFLNEAR